MDKTMLTRRKTFNPYVAVAVSLFAIAFSILALVVGQGGKAPAGCTRAAAILQAKDDLRVVYGVDPTTATFRFTVTQPPHWTVYFDVAGEKQGIALLCTHGQFGSPQPA